MDSAKPCKKRRYHRPSTSLPSLSRHIAARLGERGVEFADAPVSGGEEGARSAALPLSSGRTNDVRALPELPLGDGKSVVRVGDVGAGGIAKLVNNMIVGSTFAVIAEGFGLAVRNGMDPQVLYEAMREGWAGRRCSTLAPKRSSPASTSQEARSISCRRTSPRPHRRHGEQSAILMTAVAHEIVVAGQAATMSSSSPPSSSSSEGGRPRATSVACGQQFPCRRSRRRSPRIRGARYQTSAGRDTLLRHRAQRRLDALHRQRGLILFAAPWRPSVLGRASAFTGNLLDPVDRLRHRRLLARASAPFGCGMRVRDSRASPAPSPRRFEMYRCTCRFRSRPRPRAGTATRAISSSHAIAPAAASSAQSPGTDVSYPSSRARAAAALRVGHAQPQRRHRFARVSRRHHVDTRPDVRHASQGARSGRVGETGA